MERLAVKYFRERTNYRMIVCNVLVRRLRRYLNNTWAADALPILKRKPCLPTCLPFRIADFDAQQGPLSLCSLLYCRESYLALNKYVGTHTGFQPVLDENDSNMIRTSVIVTRS